MAQQYEQLAIDFYHDNILPSKNKTKILYDGKIMAIDTNYTKAGKFAIEEFYWCKTDPRGETNKLIIYDIDPDALPEEIDFITLTDTSQKLNTPKRFKKRNKLTSTNLKSGLGFHIERIGQFLFPTKFNLFVHPAFQYNESIYIWLSLTKRDSEYGQWFITEIDIKNQKIKDWCEISWVQ